MWLNIKNKQTNNPIKKLAKDLNKHFFQIRLKDGQEEHEKMINIVYYYINAHQNSVISLLTSQNGHHQKNLQTINAGGGVEKREPSYSLGRNVN